jgi:hypothetical protein
VLSPMDMPNSTYENPLPASRAARAASGHERPDTPVPGRFHTYPEMAAAGLWTTPSDLARWAIGVSRAWGGRAGGPISPETARQMLTTQVIEQASGQRWGLAVGLTGEGDSLRFHHNGRDEGFVATLFMYPALGKGIVVMTNGVSGGLLNQIVRAWDAEYGLRTLPRVDRAVAAVAPATLDRYAGRYALADDTALVVTREDDHLRVRVGDGEALPVYAESETVFFRVEDGAARVEFERDASGAVSGVVLRQGNASRRATRTP